MASERPYAHQTHRYRDNFEQLDIIGKGGYATVFKAKHKMDKGTYAVKRILFKYKSPEKEAKICSEAERLAQLTHNNVVRYNSSWLEDADDSVEGNGSSTGSETCTSKSLNQGENDLTQGNSHSIEPPPVPSADDENVEDTKTKEIALLPEPNESTFPERNRRRRHSSGPTCLSVDFREEEMKHADNVECKTETSPKVVVVTPVLRVALYIQTEFCDQDLEEWLKKNNIGSGIQNQIKPTDIFFQIVNGVEYIHSQQVIHRDLKPSNIFISSKQVVKIGDFGLSCLVAETKERNENLSYVMGTAPYGAPEQKESHKYDFKVDIYSLGIILLELLYRCETRTELSIVIQKIHDGSYPSNLNNDWPDYVRLITRMMNLKPAERPTAEDILKDPLFKTKGANKRIENIRHRIFYLKNGQESLEQVVIKEIEMLKEDNEAFVREILNLRAKIQDLEMENEDLKLENKYLKLENDDLKVENDDLKVENDDKVENDELKVENEDLKVENEDLKVKSRCLKAKYRRLKAENENLKVENEYVKQGHS